MYGEFKQLRRNALDAITTAYVVLFHSVMATWLGNADCKYRTGRDEADSDSVCLLTFTTERNRLIR